MIRDGLEVKLVESPLSSERFILCRSTDRAEKERAMLEQQMTRLKAELERINQGLKKRPSINTEKIERRIGRWLGRYTAAEKLITVTLIKNADGAAVGVEIIEHTEKKDSVSRALQNLPSSDKLFRRHRTRIVEMVYTALSGRSGF